MAGVMPIRRSIRRRHVAQPVAEDLGVGRLGRGLGLDAGRGIELGHAVVEDRIVLGELVALALARDHVQELRAVQRTDVGQRGHQHVEIVAVDRADVVEAELLEQRARRDHALHVLLGAAREVQHRRDDAASTFSPALRAAA